ncbi:hypothetical protein F4604DRAFT_2013560 [Suillus subluteus]|nr:hypothetical protein F4604DRAFT_2013560 [Suillus subluteus]
MFCFTTNSLPDPSNDTFPPLAEEPSHLEQYPQDPGETHLTGMQQIVITVIKTGSAESQTSNKPVYVDQAIVEWNERIPLITAIIFQPWQGEVLSLCTSMFVTVEQRSSDENDAAVPCPLPIPTSGDMDVTQTSEDLDQSIKHFERVLGLCPMGYPCCAAAEFHLANMKFVNCQAKGIYLDLNIPINLFQDALYFRPTGHPDWPVTQLHLAIALLSLFATRGVKWLLMWPKARNTDANDLGQKQLAVSMLPLSPNQLSLKVAQCLQRDDPHDLDEVISLHYDALGYYNTMHTCQGQRRGNGQDIDEAVTLLKETLALHPAGHPNRDPKQFGSLHNLVNQLSIHFEHQSNDQDLDQAISLSREALALLPTDHLNWSKSLNNLANQLSAHFEHRGNVQDLDDAMALHREALALRPHGHPDWTKSLNNLANQLSTHSEHQGNVQDLDDAIALHTEALALFPVGDLNWFRSLHNLANQLSTHFEHRSNIQDLDQAITLSKEALALLPTNHSNCREALALLSTNHSNRSKSLNNLVNQLSTRFEHRGNDQDLDDAMALHREALTLQPDGHPDRTKSLNNLANQHSLRFKYRGNAKDLDQAIALHSEALALCPVGHPDQTKSLNNLANPHSVHFKEALALHPDRHPDRIRTLNNFANQYSIRFEYQGNDQDLDQAIALHREALTLHLVGDPNQSKSLYNLANNLSTHSRREALGLRPSGHSDQSKSLSCLANRLSNRFNDQGNGQDLDEAITFHREALALSLVGHSDRSGSLSNLAYGLSTRFKHRSNDQDLDEVIMLHREALVLCRLEVHESLATMYLLFHQSGLEDPIKDTGNLNAVMDHLKAAANVVSRGSLPRLRASLRWVHHASQHSHGTKLEAYAISMQLLDTYMSVTASVSSRHNAMKEFPSTLAMDAISCALRSGDVRHAVELLEQGRTIIWTQMTGLRTPLDSLQTHSDHAVVLMQRFRNLSSLLDKPPVSHTDGTPRVAVEAEVARYRHLVEDWNRVVEEIWRIEGFSHFLLSPLISDLQEAALSFTHHHKPLIIM